MGTRRSYTTSIDTDASNNFKVACDERGVKMNVILETFMNQFSNDEFTIRISKSGIRIDIEEK